MQIFMKNHFWNVCSTHDELLKKDGKYAQMWSSYTESINWKIGTGKAV